jgi:uroporphyrinogen III methyltransferase/synthase
MPGTVYLVGAGPGDPGLLTCRGRELLATCDCVLHDYLVNPLLLELAPAGALIRDVGKRGGRGSASQEAIQEELVRLAASHRRIVRLKGGDPFLFGRGGEEAAALAAASIPFEIVPGVTSGTGVPAYAGIPITHRAASSAVAFVTGHRQAGDPQPLDWASFARIETLVLYMGMHRLAENCQALIEHGRDPGTPACAIQWGTYPRQRVIDGTLATLPALVAAAGLGAPAITVVGEVVRYRERIRWFDHPAQRPLFGRRILVTRAREQASTVAGGLRLRGAEVIEAPVTRFAAASDPRPLDRALAGLRGRPGWIAFTSANAVRFVWERIRALGLDARAFAPARIAALGPATAESLQAYGLTADLVPTEASSAALTAALARTGGPSAILLPQADNARQQLSEGLRALGWSVEALVAYRALEQPLPVDWQEHGRIDAVTFASSGTVDRFLARAGAPAVAALIAAGCRFYAIGPQTAGTLAERGLPVAAQAAEASVAALIETVVADLRSG